MICPNCRLDRKRKERTGNKCSNCRFVFAFDPKTNPLKLHDLRFRALVDKVRGAIKLAKDARKVITVFWNLLVMIKDFFTYSVDYFRSDSLPAAPAVA